MKSLSELTDFYYTHLYSDLETLEKERRVLRDRVIMVGVVIGVIALSIMGFIYKSVGDFHNGMIFVAVAGAILGGIAYKFMIKDYTKAFKQKIIRPLINAIDEKLRYTPTMHLSQHLFERSELFKHRIDRFNGNDFVKGDIDGVSLQFSDLHAEYKTKDSKGNTSWHTIFQGLFIDTEFNKHFKGRTIILPDHAEKSFGKLIGGWLQSKNFSRDKLVKMDDPAFEKAFVVYGSDQIEARYLLTHTMMERLLRFRKRTGQKIFVSFVGSHIHLAVYYNKDLFEPTVFTSLLNYKQAMEYVETLILAIGIVEELKLNQKLWSKQ